MSNIRGLNQANPGGGNNPGGSGDSIS